MERNYLTLIGIVVGCALFLQAGCKKQAGPSEKPETALVMPESTVAPETAEITPETNEPAPKITFENLVYDFGEVEPSKKFVGEFKFTNTGEGLLKITKVDRCCGVTANTNKEEYAPGESGTLTVGYRSSPRPGTMTRRIHVNSNDMANPKVTLTIKAKITTKVDYEPKSISLLLNEENAGCPEITITSLDKKPFSIKAFNSTANCITDDANSSAEATKFILRPKVDMEKLEQNMNGHVDIQLTHPDFPKFTIHYSTMPKFRTDPHVIIISNPEPQKPVVRDIRIFNNYGEDFEIVSTSSKNGIIKVLSQEKISNGYHFEVEITPPVAESQQRIFTDTFTIDIKDNEPLTITCRGFYPPERSSH